MATYGQVKDLYDSLVASGEVKVPLADWAARQKELTGSNVFDAGLGGESWIKDASSGIDKFLESTGLTQLGADVGGAIMAPFGMEDKGQEIGSGFARSLVDFAPFLVGGPLSMGAKMVATGALSGANVYTQTDSPAAAVMAGTLNAYMPRIANFGERQVLKAMGVEPLVGRITTGATDALGRPILQGINAYLPETLGQKAASFFGGQAAAGLAMGASEVAQQALDPNQEVTNPFNVDMLLGMTLGQLPFAGVHLAGKALGAHTTRVNGELLGSDYKGVKRNLELTGENIKKLKDEDFAKRVDELMTLIESAGSKFEVPVDENLTRKAKVESILGALFKGEVKPSVESAKAVEAARIIRESSMPPEEQAAAIDKLRLDPSLNGIDSIVALDSSRWNSDGTAKTIPVEGFIHYSTPKRDIIRVSDTPENRALLGDDAIGKLLAFPKTKLKSKDTVSEYGTGGKFDVPAERQYRTFVEDAWDGKRTNEFHNLKLRAEAEAKFKADNPDLPEAQTDANYLAYKAADEVRLSDLRTKARERMVALKEQLKTLKSPVEQSDVWTQINDIFELLGEQRISVKRARELQLIPAIEKQISKAVANEIADSNAKKKQADLDKANKENSKFLESLKASTDKSDQEMYARFDVEKKKLLEATRDLKGYDEKRGKKQWEDLPTIFRAWWNAKGTDAELAQALHELVVPRTSVGAQKSFDAPLGETEITLHDLVATQTTEAGRALTEEVERNIANVIYDNKGALEQWQTENQDRGDYRPFPVHRDLFKAFIEEVGNGNISAKEIQTGEFSEKAVEAINTHFKDVEDQFSFADLQGYTKRSYVESWMGKLKPVFEAAVNKPNIEQRTPAALSSLRPFSAGDDFVWSINLDFTMPKMYEKDGIVPESYFKSHAGLIGGKDVPALELEMLKTTDKALGLGIFENGNVNVGKLKAAMENPEVWPKVTEVTEFGPVGKDPTRERYNEIVHQLDTLDPQWATLERQPTPERQALVDELPRLVQNDQVNSTESRAHWMSYSSAEHGVRNPHGYFEMAVAVPTGPGKLFTGQHAPFPPNTLIHLRGYFAEHPTEGRVMVLDEVQSDWGQQRRKEEVRSAKVTAELKAKEQWFTDNGYRLEDYGGVPIVRTLEGKLVPSEGEVKTRLQDYQRQAFGDNPTIGVADHPLLPVAHVLGLKAALAKIAKESPGTKVMIVSPETGAMTQGHDKQGQRAIITFPNGLTSTEPNITPKLIEGYKELGATIELLPLPQMGGHITNNAPTYYVIRDAEGKTLKGKVFRTEADAKAAAEPGQTVAPQTGTLVSALRSLTEDEGREVVMPGVHKQTKITPSVPFERQIENLGNQLRAGQITQKQHDNAVADIQSQAKPVGSPVFRDPSGNPETRVTGTVFNTTKSTENFLTNSGFTIGRKAMASGPITLTKNNETLFRELNFGPDIPIIETVKTISNKLSGFNGLIASDILESAKDILGRTDVIITKSGVPHAHWNDSKQRAEIYFPQGFAELDSITFYQTVLHEISHANTLFQMYQPKNFKLVGEVTALRQRVLSEMSKGKWAPYKKVLDELEKSNWIGRWTAAKQIQKQIATRHELDLKAEALNPKDPDSAVAILYGMMNDVEFVGNGHSEKAFQNFLTTFKSPQGTVRKALNWIIRQLTQSKLNDTAFAELMDISSRLTKTQNYFMRFQNYGEQFLKARGYSEEAAIGQARRAIGLVHQDNLKPLSGESLLHMLMSKDKADVDKSYMSERYVKALNRLKQTLNDKDVEKMSEIQHWLELDNISPTFTHINDMLTSAIEYPKDFATTFQNIPDEVAGFLFEKLQNAKDALDVVEAAADKKTASLIDVIQSPDLLAKIKVAQQKVGNLMKNKEVREKAEYDYQKYMLFTPQAAMQNLENVFDSAMVANSSSSPVASVQANPILRWFGDKIEQYGGKATIDFIRQGAQLAMENPLFAEYWNNASMVTSRARQLVRRALDPFGMEYDAQGQPKGYSLEKSKAMQETLKGKTGEAFRMWIAANQEAGKKTANVTMLPKEHPEVRKALAGLTEQQVNAVSELMQTSVIGKQLMDRGTLQLMSDEKATHLTTLMLKLESQAGLSIKDANMYARNMIDAFGAIRNDPSRADIIRTKFNYIQSKLSPETFASTLEMAKNMAEELQLNAEHFARNDAWVSAQRNKKYLFEYFKNGEVVLNSADNRAEAQHLAGPGNQIKNWRENVRDEDFVSGNHNVETIKRLREIEARTIEIMRASGKFDEEAMSEYIKKSPVTQFEREVAAQQSIDPLKNQGARTLSRGGSQLQWHENYFNWMHKNSAYYHKRLLRAQADMLTLAPEYTNAPEVRQAIKDHLDAFLKPDPETVRAVTHFTTIWGLGFNVASAIANSTQTFMRSVPELIAGGLTVRQAAKEIFKSWKDHSNHKWGDVPWNSPEEQAFYHKAVLDGKIDATLFDENAAAQETAATDFIAAINNEKPKTLTEKRQALTNIYSRTAMMMFKSGERANNTVTLMAAYRGMKKLHPEWTEEQLTTNAYRINDAANDVGGRANRPIGLYAKMPRGLAMIMTSMQSYTLGNMQQMVRFLKKGFFRPEGYKPAEVYAARKAAVYMLGAMFSAAGALGMPFVSSAMALLDKTFPELEVNKNVRETMNGILGGSPELTDMFMSGLPSMMGWDMQSRLSSGNILPGVSEYNGFQPELLLGVPANVFSQFVKGGIGLANGDARTGTNFVPPFLKKLVNLVGDGGKVRDYNDNPLFQPSPGEKLGIGLGFNPKQLSDYNAAQRMAKQTETNRTNEKRQVNRKLAEQALAGNFGTVQQELRKLAESDKSFDVFRTIRRIAEEAEEQTFPKDLRREGRSDQRSKLLATFQLPPNQPSEVNRLLFRTQVEQRLGLFAQRTQAMKVAQLMDQLQAQNPQATRAELRLMAEQMVSHSVRQMPSYLQE